MWLTWVLTVALSGPRLSLGAPGPNQPGLVREHDDLDAVAQAEFHENASDVALHGRFAEVELVRDLRVRETAGEEAQDFEFPLAEVGGGRLQKSSISRRVIGGARSDSPRATVRTAAASCSRFASLSRKPLAPAFIAW